MWWKFVVIFFLAVCFVFESAQEKWTIHSPEVHPELVYDVTFKKNIIVSDMCNQTGLRKNWTLSTTIYLEIGNVTSQLTQDVLNVVSRIESTLPESTFVRFGQFVNRVRICSLQNTSKVGNFTIIVRQNEKNSSAIYCSSLCVSFTKGFIHKIDHVGLDIDEELADCIHKSCPNLINNVGFIVESVEFNQISSMLSYGGFARKLGDIIESKLVRFWVTENRLEAFYIKLLINTTVGFSNESLDSLTKDYVLKYSSWWVHNGFIRGQTRPKVFFIILEGSMTYRFPPGWEHPRYNGNGVSFPKIDYEQIRNLIDYKTNSTCHLWHILKQASVNFNKFFLQVDNWQTANALTGTCKMAGNITVDPKTSVLVYGAENQEFVEKLKSETAHLDYNFPALTFLETEKINTTNQYVRNVRAFIRVQNSHYSTNDTLQNPLVLILNYSISGDEKLAPIMPELENLLVLREQIRTQPGFSNASFFVEFIIKEDWLPLVNLRKNLYCLGHLSEVKEVHEALIYWATIHNFQTTHFPLLDTNQNTGWWYNVIPESDIDKSITKFSLINRRNIPRFMAYTLKSSTCMDINYPGYGIISYHQYCNLGTTLHIDEITENAISLTETNIRNLILIAFARFCVVELHAWSVLPMVTKALNSSLQLDIAKKLNRKIDRVKLFLNINMENLCSEFDALVKVNSFTVAGIHIFGWDNAHDSKQHCIKGLHNLNGSSQIGMYVEDCVYQINQGIDKLKSNTVFLLANYIVCPFKGFLVNNFVEAEMALQKFFDTQLYMFQYFEDVWNKTMYAKILFNAKCRNRTEIKGYYNMIALIQQYATLYDIKYFFGDSFINCSTWKIQNYSDLNNIQSYVAPDNDYQLTIPLFEETAENPINSKDGVLIYSLPAVVAASIIIICGAYFYYRRQKKRILSKEDIAAFYCGDDVQVHTEVVGARYLQVSTIKNLGFNKEFEIPRKNIQIGSLIGTGNFGQVHKGTLNNTQTVAIKLPKPGCSKDAFKTMLAETRILSYLGSHQNIVEFFGAYTKNISIGLIYVITEFCENGSLEDFLKKIRNSNCSKGISWSNESELLSSSSGSNTTTSNESTIHARDGYTDFLDKPPSNSTYTCASLFHKLCRFSMEIASGMEFIAGKKVVHSDLSTRNVLLDSQNICKVSDFGLSKKLYETEAYIRDGEEALPWKWMAIESLKNMEFTTQTDVWSFGVTLWEIFSLGQPPYPGLQWDPDFILRLEEGMRMLKPDLATQEIFDKMLECWNEIGTNRPTFSTLQSFFENLFFKMD